MKILLSLNKLNIASETEHIWYVNLIYIFHINILIENFIVSENCDKLYLALYWVVIGDDTSYLADIHREH